MRDYILKKCEQKFLSESETVTLRINVYLKFSDLYLSLFVIRFSLIFQTIFVGGGKTEKSHCIYPSTCRWGHS